MPASLSHIAHFDLDSFFVSVEIRNNPTLKGKPVLVGGYDRGVVAACSYEARAFGIHSAMPMKKALQLCPHAIVTNHSRDQYSKYSAWVTDLIADRVPAFEKASIDEFYVDLTGMDRFFGISQFAREIRETVIRETGLPMSGGLSTARFISKMATNEAKPNGFLEIEPGKEKEFLWPLGVEKINGVGKQTELELKNWGIRTIAELAATPIEFLKKILGQQGESLWQKAQGIGSATVYTDWEQKSISHENTFSEDHRDDEYLHQQLVRLTEKTAYALRQEEKLTGCVTVKIRYSNFDTVSKQESIPYTALDDTLLAHVKKLFTEAREPGRPIRLLGVRFSHLIPFTLQMSLFENQPGKLKLYQAVDGLKDRYGSRSLTKAANLSDPPSQEE
ncbi:MAG: DNA polymerase IV [Bacteroidetes bacterium]|nr:DNA polymerase IV [Bacteroidota bacterium]